MAKYGVFDHAHIDEPLEPIDWQVDGYFDPKSFTPGRSDDEEKAEKKA